MSTVTLAKVEDFDLLWAEYNVYVDGVQVGAVRKATSGTKYYPWKASGLKFVSFNTRKAAVAALLHSLPSATADQGATP